MYKALDEMLELLHYIIEGCYLIRFYGSFLENRFRRAKWAGFAVILIYVMMRKAWGIISVADYEDLNYETLRIICGTFVSFLTLLVCLAGFYRTGYRMGLFLIVTFLSVRDTSYLFSYTIWQRGYSLLMAWAVRSLENGSLGVSGLMRITYLGGYGMILLVNVSFLWIMFIVLKQIRQSFREKEYPMHRRELFFLLAPEMIGLLICMMLRIIMFYMEQERPVLLYDKYPVLVLIVSLILFLSLLSIPYGVKVFQGLIDLNREKSGRIILENQINGMQRQIEEMEHIYAGIRSMKHDMRNTISIIMQLAAGIEKTDTDLESEKNGGTEENGAVTHKHGDNEGILALRKYLSELGRSLETPELRYRTGNAVVDTLLNMKYHEICRTLPGLVFEADRLIVPESLRIRSYDMGVILGNALDNAIEACGRLRAKEPEAALFIRLSSFRKGNMFFLEVENSFDGQFMKNAETEFPMTSKPDKSVHGSGFPNIRNAAGKYYGEVEWSADGRIFTLSVMMQNEKQKTENAEGKEGV